MMAEDLPNGILDLKKDLSNCEKRFSRIVKGSQNASKSLSASSKRPPWNHGASTRPQSLTRSETPRRLNVLVPAQPKGRPGRPPSAHTSTPVVQEGYQLKVGSSSSKNLVHKEIIKDSGNKKTVVEVLVKTQQRGKRSRSAHTTVSSGSHDGHIDQGDGISRQGAHTNGIKKCSASCSNPASTVPTIRKAPSWSHILKQASSQSTVTERRGGKSAVDGKSEPNVENNRNQENVRSPRQRTFISDGDESSLYRFRGEAQGFPSERPEPPVSRESGDSHIPPILDPVRTLNFLVKELRGKVQKNSDNNLHRIVSDMEGALAIFNFQESLRPQTSPASRGTNDRPSSQTKRGNARTSPRRTSPTYRRSASASPEKSAASGPPGTSQTQHNRPFPAKQFGGHLLADANLLRLSPMPQAPGTSRTKDTSQPSTAVLLENLRTTLSAVSHCAKTSPHPTERHRPSRSGRHGQAEAVTLALQEQLEAGCMRLEESCVQMENMCESLRKERDKLKEELQDKTTALLSAHATLQDTTVQCSELRTSLLRANQELLTLREDHANATQELVKVREESRKASQSSAQELKRLQELLKDKEKVSLELEMSKLEKEKLQVFLANKDIEIAKFKHELMDIQAMVGELLANYHSLADHSRTLNQLDAMMRTLSSRSLLSDSTLDGKKFESKQGARSKHSKANPVHSSPTSSATNSEFQESWKRLSTITSEDSPEKEAPRREEKPREPRKHKRKEKLVGKSKLRQPGVGGIFSELKTKSAASATAPSLPSPPQDMGLYISGMSQWTEASTIGSITLSEILQSEADSSSS